MMQKNSDFLTMIGKQESCDPLLSPDLMRLHLTGKKLAEEYRNKCAAALVGAGITLIPSEDLEDHQFVVSRGVYDAAKRFIKKGGER